MKHRDFLKELGAPRAQVELSAAASRIPVIPTAGSPRQYRVGTFVLVKDVRVWLCRDEIGFYAIDAYCPHLGCLVRSWQKGFACPCHHSRFSESGECLSGPASRSLRSLYIELDEAGQLVIRRDCTADPNDRLMA